MKSLCQLFSLEDATFKIKELVEELHLHLTRTRIKARESNFFDILNFEIFFLEQFGDTGIRIEINIDIEIARL